MTDNQSQQADSAGCLKTGAVLVLATGGLLLLGVVALNLLIANAFRECLAAPWVEGSAGTSIAVLDAAHPVAEQTVTVRIPALALPADVPEGGVLLSVDPVVSAGSAAPIAPARASQAPGPDDDIVDVAFIALDAPGAPGRIVPAVGKAIFTELPYARTAVLDCPTAEACERTYRVIVSLKRAPSAGAIALQWRAGVTVRADSFGGCPDRVPPDPGVEATDPVVGAGLASAQLVPAVGSGTIAATHLRIETDSAGEAAWARIVLLAEPSVQPDRWLPWLHVTDDAGRVLADGPAGQHWSGPQQTLVEVPVLSRCAQGAACSDGLWVVVQAIPSDVPPFKPTFTRLRVPARFSWTTSVAIVGPGAAGRGSPRISVDGTAPDPGPVPAVEAAGPTVHLADGVARSVEAAIHVPAVATETGGGDWRRNAVAVVGWFGQGGWITAKLEGPGAGPIEGGAGGVINLVAHPFDACPATGPCDVSVALVSKFTADPRSAVGGDVKSVWNFSLLGVPPGTTVTFGAPVDRSSPSGSPPPVPAVAVASAVVLAAVLLVIRRRRHGAGSGGGSGAPLTVGQARTPHEASRRETST